MTNLNICTATVTGAHAVYERSGDWETKKGICGSCGAFGNYERTAGWTWGEPGRVGKPVPQTAAAVQAPRADPRADVVQGGVLDALDNAAKRLAACVGVGDWVAAQKLADQIRSAAMHIDLIQDDLNELTEEHS